MYHQFMWPFKEENIQHVQRMYNNAIFPQSSALRTEKDWLDSYWQIKSKYNNFWRSRMM